MAQIQSHNQQAKSLLRMQTIMDEVMRDLQPYWKEVCSCYDAEKVTAEQCDTCEHFSECDRFDRREA